MSQHNDLNQDAINRQEALKLMADFEAANEQAKRKMELVMEHHKAEMETFENISKKFKKTLDNIKRDDKIFNYVLATVGVLFMVATFVGFCYQLSLHNFRGAIPLGIFFAFELFAAFFIYTINSLFAALADIEAMISD